MDALTISQPWLWGLEQGHKPVENRTWHVPQRLLGKRIALHSSKARFSRDGYAWFVMKNYVIPPMAKLPRGAFTSTALVRGSFYRSQGSLCVTGHVTPDEAAELEQSEFYVKGEIGWVFAEYRRLSEPVYHPGAQMIWRVPSAVERIIESREIWIG